MRGTAERPIPLRGKQIDLEEYLAPSYTDFLERKTQLDDASGFDPLWLPDFLFPFQRALVEWVIRQGRGAIFADCGLGKTPMQLVWAENVRRKTGRPILLITPLLDVIERTLVLWSNPGEVVLTPFMGVGSEVYAAVQAGRRGIGAELKPSYFRQAVRNLAALGEAHAEEGLPLLFDAA